MPEACSRSSTRFMTNVVGTWSPTLDFLDRGLDDEEEGEGEASPPGSGRMMKTRRLHGPGSERSKCRSVEDVATLDVVVASGDVAMQRGDDGPTRTPR